MIFSISQGSEKEKRNIDEVDEGTVIGLTVKMNGELTSESDIQVEGFVEGIIRTTRSIIVSKSAQIKGQIFGESVIVSGTIHGDIFATEETKILAQGKVFGNITTGSIGIEPGAIFNGKCEIVKNAKIDEIVKIEAPKESYIDEEKNKKGEDKEELFLEK